MPTWTDDNLLFFVFQSTFIVFVSCPCFVPTPMFDQISIEIKAHASSSSQAANGSCRLHCSCAFCLCYCCTIRKDCSNLDNCFPLHFSCSFLNSCSNLYHMCWPHFVLDLVITLNVDSSIKETPYSVHPSSFFHHVRVPCGPISLATCVRWSASWFQSL